MTDYQNGTIINENLIQKQSLIAKNNKDTPALYMYAIVNPKYNAIYYVESHDYQPEIEEVIVETIIRQKKKSHVGKDCARDLRK